MTRVGAAVANKIEAKYPHASGSGPAGAETLMAIVRAYTHGGKHCLHVATHTTKPQRRTAWMPNYFNWTDRAMKSQRKPWRR